MGSKSKTIQTSTETNIQDIDTTNIDLEIVDGVGVADVSGDVQIIVSDQEAIQAGKEISLSALDLAFGFGSDIVDRSIGTLGGAITKAGEATRSDAANTLNSLIKFGSVAAGLLGVVFIVTRARG